MICCIISSTPWNCFKALQLKPISAWSWNLNNKTAECRIDVVIIQSELLNLFFPSMYVAPGYLVGAFSDL